MANMVYVARRRCGCVVGAMVDDVDDLIGADQETRLKQISDVLRIWVRGRYQVDRVAAEDVVIQWFSHCPHVARQRTFEEMHAVKTDSSASGTPQ